MYFTHSTNHNKTLGSSIIMDVNVVLSYKNNFISEKKTVGIFFIYLDRIYCCFSNVINGRVNYLILIR